MINFIIKQINNEKNKMRLLYRYWAILPQAARVSIICSIAPKGGEQNLEILIASLWDPRLTDCLILNLRDSRQESDLIISIPPFSTGEVIVSEIPVSLI